MQHIPTARLPHFRIPRMSTERSRFVAIRVAPMGRP
jgi:hypothetical protein